MAPPKFTFPVTAGDGARGADLFNAINQHGISEESEQVLHSFLVPLLSRREHDVEEVPNPTKWHEVIECFYAVHCLNEEGRFKPPSLITGVFAKMKYIIRSVCLFEAYAQQAQHGNDLNRLVFFLSEVIFPNYLFRSMLAIGSEFLTIGVISPFNITIDYQRLASFHVMSAGRPPAARASIDGSRVSYKESVLHIPTWREGMQIPYREVKEELNELLIGTTYKMPTLVSDDWSNETRGYSWTKNHDFGVNKYTLLAAHIAAGKWSFFKGPDKDGNLIDDIATQREFLAKCSSVRFKLLLLIYLTSGQSSRLAEFMDSKFANSLRGRTLFHDGVELWTVTRRAKYETRIGHEVFLPSKIAPQVATELTRYLLLLLPLERTLVASCYGPEAAKLYDEYLCVAHGRRISDQEFRDYFKQAMREYCQVNAGVHDYRQLMVQVSRTYLGSGHEFDPDNDYDVLAAQRGHSVQTARHHYAPEIDHLPALSSDALLLFGEASTAWWEVTGFRPDWPPMLPLRQRLKPRSPPPAPAELQEPGASERLGGFDRPSLQKFIMDCVAASMAAHKAATDFELRQLIAEAVAAGLATDFVTSRSRQPAQPPQASIRQRPPRPATQPAVPDRTPLEQPPPSPPSLSYVSEKPPSVVAEHAGSPQLLPARSPSALSYLSEKDPSVNAECIAPAPTADSFADFSSIPPISDDYFTEFPEIEFTAEGDPFIPPTPLPLDQQLLSALAQCYPNTPNPSWKSPEQEQAIRIAAERKKHMVCILPCGGGKTLVWTIPAMLDSPGMLNFVIVPFIALLDQHLATTRAMNVSCSRWRPGQPAPTEKIVYISMESGNSPSFNALVLFSVFQLSLSLISCCRMWTETSGKHSRIFFDECHEIYASDSYRNLLKKIAKMSTLDCPHIFLTATLPHRQEPYFWQKLRIPTNASTVVRAATPLPTVRFEVIHYNLMETDEYFLCIQLAKNITPQLERDDAVGMIFVNNIEKVNYLARHIPSACRHHGHDPLQERQDALASWYAHSRRWIVATNGLIHGIDHRRVSVVIVFECLNGLLDLQQAAGRLDRDRIFAARCIVIQANKSYHVGTLLDDDVQCQHESDVFVHNKTECRRKYISEPMDGFPTLCSDIPNAHLCDICKPDPVFLADVKVMIEAAKKRRPIVNPTPHRNLVTPPPQPLSQPKSSNEALPLTPSRIPRLALTTSSSSRGVKRPHSRSPKASRLPVPSPKNAYPKAPKITLAPMLSQSLQVSQHPSSQNLHSWYDEQPNSPTRRSPSPGAPFREAEARVSMMLTRPHKIRKQEHVPASFKEPRYVSAPVQSRSRPPKISPPLASARQPLSSTPAPGQPSTVIRVAAAILSEADNMRQRKGQVIQDLCNKLDTFCYACWAWYDRRRPKDHRPFIDCPGYRAYVPHGFGFFKMKRKVKERLAPYEYCWGCGCPKAHLPAGHTGSIPSKDNPCPQDDFVFILLWHILYHDQSYSCARNHFPDLPDPAVAVGVDAEQKKEYHQNAFVAWAVTETDAPGCYYNGFELVVWFVQNHHELYTRTSSLPFF